MKGLLFSFLKICQLACLYTINPSIISLLRIYNQSLTHMSLTANYDYIYRYRGSHETEHLTCTSTSPFSAASGKHVSCGQGLAKNFAMLSPGMITGNPHSFPAFSLCNQQGKAPSIISSRLQEMIEPPKRCQNLKIRCTTQRDRLLLLPCARRQPCLASIRWR